MGAGCVAQHLFAPRQSGCACDRLQGSNDILCQPFPSAQGPGNMTRKAGLDQTYISLTRDGISCHIKITIPWTTVQPQSTTFRWLYMISHWLDWDWCKGSHPHLLYEALSPSNADVTGCSQHQKCTCATQVELRMESRPNFCPKRNVHCLPTQNARKHIRAGYRLEQVSVTFNLQCYF